ncbi:MAG: hypothetical protein MUC38_04665 [Cyclobacteriaceae bacterium]|jgi:hypothetical protein|nr:hypothetical protein [Cyclobacteriaceae bacterium]
MKLFLQIRVGDWRQFGYLQPWLRFASALADDVVGAEMDSGSEAAVAELVLPLCEQAHSIFVLVEAVPGAPLGSALPIFHQLFTWPHKVARVVLRGENAMATKMLAAWQDKLSNNVDEGELRERIRAFAVDQLKPGR